MKKRILKRHGGQEDHFDSHDLQIRFRPKRDHVQKQKDRKTQRLEISWEECNATVAEIFHKQCKVIFDGPPQKELLATYRRAQLLDQKTENRERTPITVGDRVLVNNSLVVQAIAKRRNYLCRPSPGRDEGPLHVIAANLDLLVIVSSALNPDLSETLIDRYLIASQQFGFPVCLVVTKSDCLDLDSYIFQSKPSDAEKQELLQRMEHAKNWIGFYTNMNIPVFLVNKKDPTSLAPLKEFLVHKMAAFCGHSGVGKTTLLRGLLGREIGKIQEVNLYTGKGKHTTTSAVLYQGPQSSSASQDLSGPKGSYWIDTPGIREFGITLDATEELIDYFPELKELGCFQKHGCRHLGESKQASTKSPSNSEDSECSWKCDALSAARLTSYKRIHQSLTG